MSNSAKVKKTVQIAGSTLTESTTINSDDAFSYDESIAAAIGGSLTTRGSDTAGTVTADDSGHGIVDSDRVDLYWSTGCAYGATVGTVSGAAIPFTGAAGDVLPSQDTDITIAKCVEVDVSVVGTNVTAIALRSGARGQFIFEDAGGVEWAVEVGAATVKEWHNESKEANPITGDTIIAIYVSHSSETAAKTMNIGMLWDNA